MRLAAIYCVWDDWDMLLHSVKNIHDLVDGVIIVGSEYSNYWEFSPQPPIWRDSITESLKVRTYKFEPFKDASVTQNETAKRNYGLQIAKDEGFTHFLMMDADEFYEHEPFLKEKEKFLSGIKTCNGGELNGLVCASQVYFKSPHLTIGLDTTWVTFIHKITPELKFEFNRRYPFAWEGNAIRIDPTRQYNINSGVEWSPIIMHHYSWVRKDFEKKIRNSTARANLERSTIRQDLLLAKSGYFCKFYQKTLMPASVNFNIPDFNVHEDIQPVAPEGS